MTPAFDAGMRHGLLKSASLTRDVQRLFAHPEVSGAAAGAAMAWAVGPGDDRWRYVPHGLVIGAGLGHMRKGRGVVGGLSGPRTPAAVPAHGVL